MNNPGPGILALLVVLGFLAVLTFFEPVIPDTLDFEARVQSSRLQNPRWK